MIRPPGCGLRAGWPAGVLEDIRAPSSDCLIRERGCWGRRRRVGDQRPGRGRAGDAGEAARNGTPKSASSKGIMEPLGSPKTPGSITRCAYVALHTRLAHRLEDVLDKSRQWTPQSEDRAAVRKGSTGRMGDEERHSVASISTLAPWASNLALGVGGVLRGADVEIFGPESSGDDDPRPADHRLG